MVEQLVAVGAVLVYSMVGTAVLFKIVDAIVGVRAPKDVEQEGLDMTLHGEEAYVLAEGGAGRALAHGEQSVTAPAHSAETA